MPSLQSYLFCALAENPLARTLSARRNKNWTLPPAELRAQVERAMENSRLPEGVKVLPLHAPLRGEWMVRAGAKHDRAFLYFHGGGYVIGSTKSSRHLLSKLVLASGLNALSVEYGLAPEAPFPAGIEDAVAAYLWMLEQGFTPESLAFVGDSGGGGLLLAAMLRLRELGLPLPSAGVCMSPVTDFCGKGESMLTRAKIEPLGPLPAWKYFRDLYVGDNDPANPLISPLYGDLKGFPPLMIHVGDHEILRDDSTRFAAKAREAGVDATAKVWPNMCHVFPALAPFFPEAREALAEIGAFLDRRVSRLPSELDLERAGLAKQP